MLEAHVAAPAPATGPVSGSSRTRLLALSNDLGLLAEEYDTGAGRQVGNFPQAFTHVMLINTARNLARGLGPAEDRERS